MNLKKPILSVLAVLLSAGAFAYPALQEDVTPLLEQYTAQLQELQAGFEKHLLPAFKSIASLALETTQAGQTDLSPEQTTLLEKYSLQLDKGLAQLLVPVLKDLDIAEFNKQYTQMAQTYNLPAKEFTLQDITALFKSMYLISALGYFEQTQKLTEDELTVLMEIFFQEEEEEQD